MPKVKFSVTLPADLVERIDAEARRLAAPNRSAVIEAWLRRGARARAADTLREETLRYYASRSRKEVAEDAAIARSLGRHAKRNPYDA